MNEELVAFLLSFKCISCKLNFVDVCVGTWLYGILQRVFQDRSRDLVTYQELLSISILRRYNGYSHFFSNCMATQNIEPLPSSPEEEVFWIYKKVVQDASVPDSNA